MADNNLPKEILIIDDDSTVGQSVEGPLSSYKVKILNTQDIDTAMYYFENKELDVVFVELEFEPLNGLTLIQKLRSHKSPQKRATSFVLIKGKPIQATEDAFIKELMDIEIINKPFNLVQILPYLSRGKSTKQRLLKFESFKEALFTEYNQSKNLSAVIGKAKEKTKEFGLKNLRLICDLYDKGGQYQEGLDFIKPYLEKDPGSTLFLQLSGHFLLKLKSYEKAKSYLDKAYKNNPFNLRRLEDLIDVNVELGNPEEAQKLMLELIKLNPEQENRKFDLFKTLLDKGYDEQAQSLCKKTTKPMEVVRFYNNKGVALSKEGDIEGAIKEYEKALKLYPTFKENYRLHYNIALAHIKFKKLDRYKVAKTNLEKCLKLQPKFEKASNTLKAVKKAINNANIKKAS